MVLVEQANPDRMGTTREPTLNSFQSALNSRNDESARSVSPGYSLSTLVRSRGNYDLITSRWSPHLKKRVAAVCSRMLSTAGNTAGKKLKVALMSIWMKQFWAKWQAFCCLKHTSLNNKRTKLACIQTCTFDHFIRTTHLMETAPRRPL